MPFAIEELYVLPLQVDFEILLHYWNKSKHLEAFWFKGTWWILLLSHWGGLQMCLELVVNKITQIPYCCKVGETHVEHSNFLNQDWKDNFIIWILTRLYKCHFQIKNFDKLIFVNNNCPLDLCIGCCKHFNLASACEANFDLTKEPKLEFDDGMEREGFLKVLWCHSFTSLPKKGKTCLWILIRHMRACQRKFFGFQHLDAEIVEFIGKSFMKHKALLSPQMLKIILTKHKISIMFHRLKMNFKNSKEISDCILAQCTINQSSYTVGRYWTTLVYCTFVLLQNCLDTKPDHSLEMGFCVSSLRRILPDEDLGMASKNVTLRSFL